MPAQPDGQNGSLTVQLTPNGAEEDYVGEITFAYHEEVTALRMHARPL